MTFFWKKARDWGLVIIVTAGLLFVGFVIGYAVKDSPKDEFRVVVTDWKRAEFTPIDCPMPKEHQEFLYELCRDFNLSFTFILALVQAESEFDYKKISSTGDYGYMQINKVNHIPLTQLLGVTNFIDPYQNLLAGCFMIHDLFIKYEDSGRVLMAYHLGEAGARKLWDQGIYTTAYCENIFAIQELFSPIQRR